MSNRTEAERQREGFGTVATRKCLQYIQQPGGTGKGDPMLTLGHMTEGFKVTSKSPP